MDNERNVRVLMISDYFNFDRIFILFFLQSSPPWKHDYALVVLRKRHKRRFILPYAWNQNLATLRYFVHFSDFDFTSYPVQLKYRFCVVLNDTGDVLHSQCDATDMGSGAGVYIRPYDPRSMTWSRHVSSLGCKFILS